MTQTFDDTVKSPNSGYFSGACAELDPVAGVHYYLKQLDFRRGRHHGRRS
jgi:hypothetical protein